jgi:chromosome segregation ATPase
MEAGKKGVQVKTEKLEEQLKEWGVDLEKLKSRANKARAEAKSEIDREVASLRTRLNEAQKKLAELKTAGDAASGEMRKGVENAWVELRKAFESATSKFKG